MPLVLTLINLRGIREASGTNNLLVSNYHPFFPNGFSGMFSGGALIFFAFIDFNTITMIAEEVKDTEKNVPRATFSC